MRPRCAVGFIERQALGNRGRWDDLRGAAVVCTSAGAWQLRLIGFSLPMFVKRRRRITGLMGRHCSRIRPFVPRIDAFGSADLSWFWQWISGVQRRSAYIVLVLTLSCSQYLTADGIPSGCNESRDSGGKNAGKPRDHLPIIEAGAVIAAIAERILAVRANSGFAQHK